MESARIRNLKVGVAALVGVLLLGFSYWYVGSLRLASGTYTLSVVFRDAQGVDTGTPVMMAGVKIGGVEKVDLTPSSKALLQLRISDRYAVPKGSAVRLSNRSLLGDPFVEVLPGPPGAGRIRTGHTLVGQSQFTMDDLLPKIADVLERLDRVGASAESLLSDRALRDNLGSAASNVRLASAAGLGLIADMRSVAAENRDEVNRTTSSLASAMANLDIASRHIEEFLSGAGRGDLSAIVANLKDASSDIRQASLSAKDITGDAAMKDDLQASIRNVRETTEAAKAIVERVSRAVGAKAPADTPGPKPPRPPTGTGPQLDFLYDSDRGKLRTDLNFTYQLPTGTFFRLGAHDLGEDAKLNLQAGKTVKPGHAFRGGLYQSRLAIGYDWQASDRWTLKADVYRPNEPRVDIKGLIDLSPEYGGWLGVEDIGGSNRAVAGLQLRF